MGTLGPYTRCIESAHGEAYPGSTIDVSGWSPEPTSKRTFPAKLTRLLGTVATLGLMAAASTSPGHTQLAPPLGPVLPTFGVLAGAAVTNVPPSTITGTAALPGNVGAVTALPATPIITTPGVTEPLDSPIVLSALSSLGTAYAYLAAQPGVNLSGQNLGGLTLIPGVYTFSSSAQLTGNLTLNALGNPNAIFVINIGSTLTTASASSVTLINGAQGGNVFWRVGSSATLGTTTSFSGDILALASITLDTNATVTCGALWAQTGSVSLDSNTITLCNLIAAAGGGPPLGPTGFPLLTALLPSSAPANDFAIATGLDNAIAGGATLPPGFLALFTLSPTALENALMQLSGEAGTAVAPAGIQAMNSLLSVVSNPFADTRGYTPPPQPPLVYKALALKAPAAAAPDLSRWGIWTAAYGGQSNAEGNPFVGSNDRTATVYGSVVGVDYRVTPYTLVGAALAAGGTNYGLANGLGGGHSDMFQAALYSFTRFNAAYVSATVAYGWQHESTDRVLNVAGTDDLGAGFGANDIGGRIEGGYRFAVPGVMPGLGFIPYAALQMVAFYTPSYNESATSGSPQFALAYNAQTTTVTRTELGAWVDDNIALDNGAILTLRSRAAWAYDNWSGESITAAFQALPGSSFTVFGAVPAHNSLLASGGAEISYRNGISLAGLLDTDLSKDSRTYSGFVRLRYTW
jgi:outer membrane autotransporter protein